MNIAEQNIKVSKLQDKVWDMELMVSNVNSITKDIKYIDTPSNIYSQVQDIAENSGVDINELEDKIDEVREAVNALKSAIYGLVEPFEDRQRELDNEKCEIECDISDYEWELKK